MRFFGKKKIEQDTSIYPFVYDKTYNEYMAVINTMEFRCNNCTKEIVEYALAIAKAYEDCLSNIVDFLLADDAFDQNKGIYKGLTKEKLSLSLKEPSFLLTSNTDGQCSYCNHTLDANHIIDIEFSGILEQLYNVSIDG